MKPRYFYNTYLACRLAGMAHQPAQELAYLCQTLDEMVPNTELSRNWFWQQHTFTPCLSGAGNSKADAIADPARRNSEYLFRCLPDLAPLTQNEEQQSSLTKLFSGAVNKVQTWFNPLTDIDWLKNGKFRERLQQRLMKQAKEQSQTVSQSEQDNTPKVICRANSQTAINLLKASFAMHSNSSQTAFNQALLASAIYTFQNTWLQPEQENRERDDVVRQQAFLATIYALKCYLDKTPPIKSTTITEHQEIADLLPLPISILELFCDTVENTNPEQNCLYMLLQMLEYYQCTPLTVDEVLFDGLRYRPNYYLDLLKQSGAVNNHGEITDISAFKNSHYYQLNKAMSWQSHWLAKQFKDVGINNMPIIQSVGDERIWQ